MEIIDPNRGGKRVRIMVKETSYMKNLGSFTADVQKQENGLYDVYISHEGSSGEHYTDVTADKIGELIADDIECIAESY